MLRPAARIEVHRAKYFSHIAWDEQCENAYSYVGAIKYCEKVFI